MLNDFIQALNNTQFSLPLHKSIQMKHWYTAVKNLLKKTNRIYIIGNGASCSMASHYATDFTKNCWIPAESLNDGALLTCFINDFSFETSYTEILKHKQITNDDLLIAISSSGNSANIVNAIEMCSNVLTFSGFNEDNKIRNHGYGCYVPSHDYGIVESCHNFWLHKLVNEVKKNE
jgi:D-sedoheptulose 7-phosphate isomerase